MKFINAVFLTVSAFACVAQAADVDFQVEADFISFDMEQAVLTELKLNMERPQVIPTFVTEQQATDAVGDNAVPQIGGAEIAQL